jgi:hypothetical protein
MECWDIGLGGRRSVFKGLAEVIKIGSDLYLLLIPNIPFFHPSKGGSSTFHYPMGQLMANTAPLG